jgi:poly(3-hydroxybutyrate) depolymerase
MLDAANRVCNGEDLDIRSEGALLHGRLYRPQGTPKAALVVHGATGAPQGIPGLLRNERRQSGTLRS